MLASNDWRKPNTACAPKDANTIMKLGLWVLAALAAGIGFGAFAGQANSTTLSGLAQVFITLGDLWLDALRMTLVPLIVSVLISAVAAMADAASAGRLARRALILFAGLILLAGLFSILATDALLALWPVAPETARALVDGASGAASTTPTPAPALDMASWARSLVPTNVVAAAAEDAVLPLVAFACLFGFALTQLPAERRAPLVGFFQASADAMIVIVMWVLALAPIGVFGLATSLGVNTGLGSIGALAHYIAIVCAVTIASTVVILAVGVFAGGFRPARFLRALAPVQVIAASTQSSLASLPAMLTAALQTLEIPPRTAEFVLPLAVAVFRFTSPVANLAVALFLAHLYGMAPTVPQLAAALAVAFAVSVSSVGLPGQTSFFASVAPICLALGVPVELLPLLLAVEVIPDVFRTIGNVTADMTATALLHRSEKKASVAST
jgi:proton glutamate symport protein